MCSLIKSAAVNDCNSESKECPYLVKVTADVLNIRKGAGTDTVKVGSITDRGDYTIVAEENGNRASKWGKLKSGAVWISLDYTKKFNFSLLKLVFSLYKKILLILHIIL